MNKQQLSNALHVGGSLENALSGNYKLSASSVIQEAIQLTQKHFWRFLPAILMLMGANVVVFLLLLSLMTPSVSAFFDGIVGKVELGPEVFQSGQIAVFLTGVLTSPLYAAISLMGLSHAIGFKTKPRHIIKGFAFAMPVVIATGLVLCIQSLAREMIPFLSLFLGVTFSMSILLICEKRLSPVDAMKVSFLSVIKKLFPLLLVSVCIGLGFLVSYITAGIALFWILPFMFNVKGILYREMYGVGIEVTVLKEGDDDPSSDEKKNEVFNA